MALRRHHRQTRSGKLCLQPCSALLVPRTYRLVRLEVTYACECPCRDRRRQRRGENETRRMASEEINECRRCSHITANDPDCLCKRALYCGDTVHQALALGHVAQLGYGCDVAIHRIDRFKADQLRAGWVGGRQQPIEITDVVVTKSIFFGATMSDALDHGGVIEGVGKDHAARDLAS